MAVIFIINKMKPGARWTYVRQINKDLLGIDPSSGQKTQTQIAASKA